MIRGALIGAGIGATLGVVGWATTFPRVGDAEPDRSELAAGIPAGAVMGALVGAVIGSETGRPNASPESSLRLFATPGVLTRLGVVVAF